jgi:hypothetical protein
MNVEKYITPEEEKNIERYITPEKEKAALLSNYAYNNLAEVFNSEDIELDDKVSIAVDTLMNFNNMLIGDQFDYKLSFEGLKSYFTKNTQSLVGYFTGLSLTAKHFNTVMKSDLPKELKLEFFANSLTFDFINQIEGKQKSFNEFIKDPDLQ